MLKYVLSLFILTNVFNLYTEEHVFIIIYNFFCWPIISVFHGYFVITKDAMVLLLVFSCCSSSAIYFSQYSRPCIVFNNNEYCQIFVQKQSSEGCLFHVTSWQPFGTARCFYDYPLNRLERTFFLNLSCFLKTLQCFQLCKLPVLI